MMPGRALDVVLAAAYGQVMTVQTDLWHSPLRLIVHLRDKDEQTARNVFALLGAIPAVRQPAGRADFSYLEATVTHLDAYVQIVVDRIPDPVPSPDAGALVADVDTARAAEASAEGGGDQ